MKQLIKSVLSLTILLTLFGCASTNDKFDARLQPPQSFNSIFMRYKELPGEKVIVVAVDSGELWSFGYDYNRDSLAEAAENAAEKCDTARKELKVKNTAKIFAINNEVVYYNQFK